MPRIVIACPNLSLDRTMWVDEVSTGAIHRSSETDVRGGGKGVNVARALARMAFTDTVVIGLAAGYTGEAVLGLLADEGIATLAVQHDGETRSCLTVIGSQSITVFNESGPRVRGAAWDSYVGLATDASTGADVFVCSGSFPPGVPHSGAAILIEKAKSEGTTTICDTSRAYLAESLASQPDYVTPNLSEAHGVLHGTIDEPVDPGAETLRAAEEAAKELAGKGARVAVVSAGSAGAAAAYGAEQSSWRAAPVNLVNPVGAGDCLVAGIALGLIRGLPIREGIGLGLAMASAGCETFYAGDLERARAERLLEEHFGG